MTLLALELIDLGMKPNAKAIQSLFRASEAAIFAEKLNPAQEKALGLLIKANARTLKPMALDRGTFGIEGPDSEPTIWYQLEGETKRRKVTHHHLQTYILPKVSAGLKSKKGPS